MKEDALRGIMQKDSLTKAPMKEKLAK